MPNLRFALAAGIIAVLPLSVTGAITYDFTPPVVPEPGTLALFSVGLASLLGFMRLRNP